MKLKRLFYVSSFNFGNISKERLVLGITIGLATAFAIYGFMYLLRESFRLMSHGFGYLPNILSEFERNVYNWFFASLALIFGNSIAISIVFSGLLHGFGKRNYRNRRIINNQSALNIYFGYWFAKFSFAIAIFSSSFTDFNFLPDFILPIVLLVLVLYLETWKTLSLQLGKNKFKWMSIHFLLFLSISFGLSKIDFIDYKTIDNNQLKYHPIIDLPNSNLTNVTYFDRYLNVTLSKEDNDYLLFENYQNKINESYLDFLDFKLARRNNSKLLAIRLMADSKTKMESIIKIKEQIIKGDINNIIFATQNEDEVARRFSSDGIKLKIVENQYFENNKLNQVYFHREYFDVEKEFTPTDTVKIKIDKKKLINDSVISDMLLINELSNHIKQEVIFEYEFSIETEYQDFIIVLSSHLIALDIIRKKNSRVELEWDDIELKYKNKKEFLKDQQRLRYEFPFRVIEKIN